MSRRRFTGDAIWCKRARRHPRHQHGHLFFSANNIAAPTGQVPYFGDLATNRRNVVTVCVAVSLNFFGGQ